MLTHLVMVVDKTPKKPIAMAERTAPEVAKAKASRRLSFDLKRWWFMAEKVASEGISKQKKGYTGSIPVRLLGRTKPQIYGFQSSGKTLSDGMRAIR